MIDVYYEINSKVMELNELLSNLTPSQISFHIHQNIFSFTVSQNIISESIPVNKISQIIENDLLFYQMCVRTKHNTYKYLDQWKEIKNVKEFLETNKYFDQNFRIIKSNKYVK